MPLKRKLIVVFIGLYATLFSYFSLFNFRSDKSIDPVDVGVESLLAVLMGLLLISFQRFQGPKKVYSFLTIGLGLAFLSYVSDVLDEFCDFPNGVNYLIDDSGSFVSLLFIIMGIQVWIKHNNMLMEELQMQATVDGLTGLTNRQAIDLQLEEFCSQAKRYTRDFSVILFDIDFFKKINDTYGHSSGDTVLQCIALLVAAQLRDCDKLGRYGGEEFLILLPETDSIGAKAVAEKIRRSIESHQFESLPTVTASFGVAQLDTRENSAHLIQRADESLYIAKDSGRNCVISSDE